MRHLGLLVVLTTACGGIADVEVLTTPGSLDGGASTDRDGGPRDAGPRDAGTCVAWPDVEPIFADACSDLCHSNPPRFSAPMSLESFVDFHRTGSGGAPIYALVGLRIQAPSGRMPPPTHSRQLTGAEILRIEAWVDALAPIECP